MEARDWGAAGELLSPQVRIQYSETGERFDGAQFLAMNRAYPQGWSLVVVEVIANDTRVGAQVRVDHGDNVYWCAGFYTVSDGVIVDGMEHWVSERSEEPPAWRSEFSTP
jgi:SnoaL-like domain